MTLLPIPGHEETYWASAEGVISTRRRRGSHGGALKAYLGTNGYLNVDLYLNGSRQIRTVHSLIAETFLGPRPDGHLVRHLNGNALDNRIENLQYGTPSENAYDSVAHGTHWQVVKTQCPQGHPYDDENTRVIPSRPTARYCRACGRRQAVAA
ncbi:MAG: HNH endonuclease [Rhodoglobus sp.]